MPLCRHLVWVVPALVAVHLASAQPMDGFRQLSRTGGLSDDSGMSVAQDRRGFIWIATANGLNRYDGARVERYYPVPGDSTSLPYLRVDAVHGASDGTVLVGTNNGFARYDELANRFVRYPIARVRPDARVIIDRIVEDSSGTIWLGSWENGLLRMGSSRSVPVPVDLSGIPDLEGPSRGSTTIHDILPTDDGLLWVSGFKGVFRIDPAEGREDPPDWPAATRSFLRSVVSFDLLSTTDGDLWVGTIHGLARINHSDGSVRRYSIPDRETSLEWNTVQKLYQDRRGVLWMGTAGGLARFDAATDAFVRYDHVDGLPGSIPAGSVRDILEDHSGVLWVTVDGGGAASIDLYGQPVQTVRHVDGLPGTVPPGLVTSIVTTGDGTVWVGSLGGFGVWNQETRQFSPVRIRNALDQGVLALLVDHADNLWIATINDGPCRFDRRTQICTVWKNGQGHGVQAYALAETADGAIWSGTYGNLLRYDPASGRVDEFTNDPDDSNTLSSRFVPSLAVDNTGRLWIGTELGLDTYEPVSRSIRRVIRADGLPTDLAEGGVMEIRPASDGRLWIMGRGIRLFDPVAGTVAAMDPAGPEEGLGLTHGFELDRRGRPWVNYNGIIVGLERDGQPEVRIGNLPGRRSIRYYVSAAHRARNGTVYLGFDDGFYAFNPDSLAENPFPPHVQITGFVRNDRRRVRVFEPDDSLDLGPADRVLTLEFAATHFSAPNLTRYEFRLDDFDTDWRRTGNAEATYTALPPGNYRFRVRATAANHLASPQEATLAVTVHPPWWNTLWFRALAILAMGAILAGGAYWRVRSVVLRNRILDRLVDERTRQLSAQSDQLAFQAAELLQADEMKTRFFSNVSHELRTPLTLISGYLDDLITDGDAVRHGGDATATVTETDTRSAQDAEAASRKTQQSRLVRIRELSERIENLVSQLLDLARADSGRLQFSPKRGELAAFLHRAVSHYSLAARNSGIELVLELDQDEVWLEFDPPKLDQILGNLIGNALKFTPSGGSVWVTMERKGDRAIVLVADTGPGIPSEFTGRVFDRFFQVEQVLTRSKGGLGIGLSLARDFAELHGGSLTLNSERFAGAVFRLELPIVDIGPARESALPGPSRLFRIDDVQNAVPPGTRPKLLVAEDDAELKDFLVEHLADVFDVEAASDGQDAWDRLTALRPDIILSDVMMPRMSGLDLLKAVRAHDDLHAVPFVLLTARSGTDDQIEGLEAHADDFVAKPFNSRVLRLRLLNLVAMRKSSRGARSGGSGHDSEATAFLDRLESYIDEHLDDPSLSIPDIASALFTSERTLQRRIKELTSQPAGTYVRGIRLERARSMLESGQVRSVSGAAQAIGFVNVSHFARAFEQQFGVAPRAFVC